VAWGTVNAMTPASELEGLLDDDRWIRRLARGLVADRATADDLAQDTWVAALEAREGRAARPWLGRVLRNAWKDGLRRRARRARREEGAARAEGTPGADELVAELELRERVARALRELEEPYRSALVRRYFRDESLSAIARQENVAVSTIHERIERGLERLRQRLDAEHGGRRGAWAVTMLALARRPGAAIGPLEVATMTVGLKTAVVLTVLGSAAAWWFSDAERAGGTDPLPAAPEVAESAPAPAPRTAEPLEPAETREALPATPFVPSPALALTNGPEIVGRVVTTANEPVSGVELVMNRSDAEPLRTTSAFDGSFVLEVAAGEESNRVRCADPRFVTLVAGAPGEERLVIVGAAVGFSGTVVEEGGVPITGAALTFHLRASLFRELGLQAAAADAQTGWGTTSDATGRFALAGLAGGALVGLEVRALGYLQRDVDLAAEGDGHMSIVLERDTRVLEFAGRVLSPDQLPFAGARVSAGREIVTSAADGTFVLSSPPDTGHFVQDEGGTWRPEVSATVRVIALAPGRAPALQEFPRTDPPGEVVLVLGQEPLSIAGRVLDPAGEPISGVIVWPRALTAFGRVPRGLDGVLDRELTVEEELCGTGVHGAVTATDGSFALGCLLDLPYDLDLFDSHTAMRTSREGVAAGTLGLEIVLTPEPGTRRVAGRVISSGGEPRSGVMIKPRRTGNWNQQPPQLAGGEYWRETDAEGRFEFEALATAGTMLDVFGTPWKIVALEGLPDLDEIEIVMPLLCEMQVVLADPALADELTVLDEHGTELEVVERIHMDGHSVAFSMGERSEITDGRSSVIQAPETSRMLVLFKASVEVLRMPLTLDPQQLTLVRP
jgi:RNA polymerase sigma factor (sigma-70 family)